MGAALLVWAALLTFVAPRLLLGARWPVRSPRLGILAWQAASGSVLTAVVFGGILLAVPIPTLPSGLAEVLAHCLMSIREAYRTPAAAFPAGLGLLLATSVVTRLAVVLASQWRHAARRRRALTEALTLIGRLDPGLGAVVVEHPTPAVYCLPGRRRLIVITTGALAALDHAELDAVVAHERAHLSARHHLAVAAASSLAQAFPRVALLAGAAEQIPRLVEMAADDTAGARGDRGLVAGALVALAGAAKPAGALAVGGPAAVARVRRLLDPAAPLSRWSVLAGVLSAMLLLAGPAALALAPTTLSSHMPDCVSTAASA